MAIASSTCTGTGSEALGTLRASSRALLPQGEGVVLDGVGGDREGFAHHTDAAGTTRGGEGVQVGGGGVGLDQTGGHDQVLGDTFGVVLGESLQLVAGNPIQIRCQGVLGDDGVVVARADAAGVERVAVFPVLRGLGVGGGVAVTGIPVVAGRSTVIGPQFLRGGTPAAGLAVTAARRTVIRAGGTVSVIGRTVIRTRRAVRVVGGTVVRTGGTIRVIRGTVVASRRTIVRAGRTVGVIGRAIVAARRTVSVVRRTIVTARRTLGIIGLRACGAVSAALGVSAVVVASRTLVASCGVPCGTIWAISRLRCITHDYLFPAIDL
jgi:hypothetical protein